MNSASVVEVGFAFSCLFRCLAVMQRLLVAFFLWGLDLYLYMEDVLEGAGLGLMELQIARNGLFYRSHYLLTV